MGRSPGSRERTVCENCQLPFYDDRGECPYCAPSDARDRRGVASESSGFVFDSDGSRDRPRTACSECGLPYFEDEGPCPYCDSPGRGSVDVGPPAEGERPVDTGADADEDAEPPAPASGTEPSDDDGILARIRGILGL